MNNSNLRYNKLVKVLKFWVPMYDWIEISLKYEKDCKGSVKGIIPVGRYTNFFTGTSWTNGYIVNPKTGRKLGANINDNGWLKISVCPPKFIKGNNVEKASISETSDLFYELQELLKVDLLSGMVHKLDLTHTAKTDFKPITYYPHLCNEPTYKRYEIDTSLYYSSNSKNIKKVIYDKVNEVDKRKTWGKRQNIPQEYKDSDLTRFEVKLGNNKTICQASNKTEFLVRDLFIEENVVNLNSFWNNEWNSIPKETDIKYDMEKTETPKDLKRYLQNIAYQSIGRLEIEKHINKTSKAHNWNKKQKYRAKKMLLKEFLDSAEMNEQIAELDKKFNDMEVKWS